MLALLCLNEVTLLLLQLISSCRFSTTPRISLYLSHKVMADAVSVGPSKTPLVLSHPVFSTGCDYCREGQSWMTCLGRSSALAKLCPPRSADCLSSTVPWGSWTRLPACYPCCCCWKAARYESYTQASQAGECLTLNGLSWAPTGRQPLGWQPGSETP